MVPGRSIRRVTGGMGSTTGTRDPDPDPDPAADPGLIWTCEHPHPCLAATLLLPRPLRMLKD
jgi:hypothetical protein